MKTNFLVGALGCVLALSGCGAPDNSAPNSAENAIAENAIAENAIAKSATVGTASEATSPNEKIYAGVRGQIVAVVKPAQAKEPSAVEIDHEKIPDFMEAMRMTIPLRNDADAEKIKAGDKIRFDLKLGKGLIIDNIEILPASTKLNLAAKTGANS